MTWPCLNGRDLNSRTDCSASRWIVNFYDWPESRAQTYSDVFEVIQRGVKPERQRRKSDGSFVLRRPLPERWWQYAEKRPGLVAAIAGLDRVLVCSEVTKHLCFCWVDAYMVYSANVDIFPNADSASFAVLHTSMHDAWARRYSSQLEDRLKYSPGNAFETFPFPKSTIEMRDLGDRLDLLRGEVMSTRNAGLTATYNLVHQPGCIDEDISELRCRHREIDEATVRAYGWDDLLDQLDHGFHADGGYLRYTIGPAAQREILDRLLELNHERYAEEVAKGLHDKKRGSRVQTAPQDEGALFDVE